MYFYFTPEGKDTTELFRFVHYIITQYGETTEEDVFTQKQRLIRQYEFYYQLYVASLITWVSYQ